MNATQTLSLNSDRMGQLLSQSRPSLFMEECGELESVGAGIAWVHGLPGVESEELVRFASGGLGLVFTLRVDAVGVVLLDNDAQLRAGDEVVRTGKVLEVEVGEGLLGRVVDAVGRPLDGAGPLGTTTQRPLETPVPSIVARAPVDTPLQTGIKVIDALVPIGHGQRELILGDRQTGKTALAIDTIANQRCTDTVCIYCAIGQRASAVARAIDELRRLGAAPYTVVVVAGSEDAAGLQYLAPYAATSMGEYFMRAGRKVLVVFDDLTRHAQAYRSLSLLMRRPPGREAYPGDIFYLHSRLLERATHLRTQDGGGSLTALPIIETEAGDVAAYIPTNLISITDGQILTSTPLFQKAVLPAVEVGRSVSRIGGEAQLPAYRAVAAEVRLAYAQFEELEAFSRFDTRLSDETRATLTRGQRVREILKQTRHDPLTVAEQVGVLLAATGGLFDALPLSRVAEAERAVRAAVLGLKDSCARIQGGRELDAADRAALMQAASEGVAALGHAR